MKLTLGRRDLKPFLSRVISKIERVNTLKRILVLVAMLSVAASNYCYSSDTSKVEVRASVNDGTSSVEDSGLIVKTFSTGIRKQETLTLSANTNTNLVKPTAAKGVLIDIGSNRSLHLIGEPGDKGISLDSSCPVMLPLSSDGAFTNLRISNDGAATTVYVYWM